MIKKNNKNNSNVNSQYLCFYDSEFNAYDNFVNKSIPQEIVSIGMCIVDKNNVTYDTFHSYIKLKVAKKITKRCTELTNITNRDMLIAISFTDALEYILQLLKKYKISQIYCYGQEDKNAFVNTLNLYKNNNKYKTIANKFVDIRTIFKNATNGLVGDQGLNFLKKICELSGDVKHNALSDAIDLSNVHYVIFNKGYNKKLFKKLTIEREELSNYKRAINVKPGQSIKASQEIIKARNKVIDFIKNSKIPNMNNGTKNAICDDLLNLLKE